MIIHLNEKINATTHPYSSGPPPSNIGGGGSKENETYFWNSISYPFSLNQGLFVHGSSFIDAMTIFLACSMQSFNGAIINGSGFGVLVAWLMAIK